MSARKMDARPRVVNWIVAPQRRKKCAGCRTSRRSSAECLDVETELHDVPVFDDVVLAFDAQLAGFARLGMRAEGYEIIEVDGLGGNESALEIAVDDAGGSGRLIARADRPGARFLL